MELVCARRLVLGLVLGCLSPADGAALDFHGLAEGEEDAVMLNPVQGPYSASFFRLDSAAWGLHAGIGAAMVQALEANYPAPLPATTAADQNLRRALVELIKADPGEGPLVKLYGPYGGIWGWRLALVLDRTYLFQEQTYDILADKGIPWSMKRAWTANAVKGYVGNLRDVLSPAPLDITLRRTGAFLKPYYGCFRQRFPLSAACFNAAWWWQGAAAEALLSAGPGKAQAKALEGVDELFFRKVLGNEPDRQLLSREVMPRYSRLSPEAANILDNMRALHGLALDILAYPDWTLDQKRDELYRVLDAMTYRRGDEWFVRKFETLRPRADPLCYDGWLEGAGGAYGRIVAEMVDELLPALAPAVDDEARTRVRDQVRKKLRPGLQAGEVPGSLYDAVAKVLPGMGAPPSMTQPGQRYGAAVQLMLRGWLEKYGDMPDLEGWRMDPEPELGSAQ